MQKIGIINTSGLVCKAFNYKHFIFIMRMSLVVLTGVCLSINILVASPGYSQGNENKIISLNHSNVSLLEVFKSIENQANVIISYEYNKLNKKGRVTIQQEKITVKNALDLILKGKDLIWEIRENIITVKSPKASEATAAGAGYLRYPDLDSPPPITVRGRIVNENGEPVIASVIVKGTNKGSTTNLEGFFLLNDVSEKATLIISGISIETREYEINGKSEIVITTRIKISAEEEVVINKGYYSEKKMLSTGNVSKVTSKDIANQPVTSPLLSLQGRMAGVDVSPSFTGLPGAVTKIRIRGQNSINGDQGNPLFVIDGIVVDSRPIETRASSISTGYDPLSALNVENIASIEILKDADATAIYGSRGANGVVLITTKRGNSGKVQVDVNLYHGAGKIGTQREMLNTEEYLTMRREAFKNNNEEPTIYSAPDLLFWDQNKYTNWQDQLLGGSADITDVQTNISGGTQYLSFRFGAAYHKEGTVFPGDFGFKKFNGQFNLDYNSPNQKLHFDVAVNYGSNSTNIFESSGFITQSIFLPPNAPDLLNSDGSINWAPNDAGVYTLSFNNPMGLLKSTNEASHESMNIGTLSTYKISNKLTGKLNVGYTKMNGEEFLKFPLSAYDPFLVQYFTGNSKFGINKRSSWIIEPQLQYNEQIGNHLFNVIAGSTLQENYSQYTSISAEGYTSDAFLNSLRSAPNYRIPVDDNTQYRYTAIFGRIGYNFKNKYLLNFTGRRDGSSRFGSNNKFGNFGAIGASWIASNENFIKNNFSWISLAKFTSSIGITGSDQIGDYKYYNTYASTPFPYNGIPNLLPTALYNPDFQWEKTRKSELGIQLGFLNDRINIDVAYYKHQTSNQLIEYQLPQTTGFTSILRNMPATIQNTGWEFLFGTQNFNNKIFKWTTSFNITLPKNKLTEFKEIEFSPYAQSLVVGQPLSILKLYNLIGVNAETGEYEFEDVNSDELIDEGDRHLIKDITSTYFGGINNQFQFANFQLSFLFQFGRRVVPNVANGQMPGSVVASIPKNDYDSRWKKPGDNSSFGKVTTSFSGFSNFINYLNSDAVNQDITFTRLKTLNISYNIPNHIVKRAHLINCNVFLEDQNLLTFVNHERLDFETGNTNVPLLTSITFGINLKF